MRRTELWAWWEKMGGEVHTNVKKKTNLVIVGHSPGGEKRKKAIRYGIPYIPYTTLDLVGYWWRREEPLVELPNMLIRELNILYLELVDGIVAHSLLTGSSRLGGLASIAQGVAAGVLRITRGSPVESPSGESLPVSLPTDTDTYVRTVIRGAIVLAEQLKLAAKEGEGYVS